MSETTYLTNILRDVRARLTERQTTLPMAAVREIALAQPSPRVVTEALRSADGGVALIAEIKRASPSKGMLDADLDPVAQARMYARGGARMISILTEQDHFKGSLDDLRAVRQAVDLPLLRKDFLIDPYQIVEARAAGADTYLLIVALLDDAELVELMRVGRELGMEPLVEAHNAVEVQRAVVAGARLIGVNARDLRTFQVDTTLLQRLKPLIPATSVVVAESGLFSAADVARMRGYGADAVLIGEALVRRNLASAQSSLLETITHLPPVLRMTPRGRYPVIKLCGMRTIADAKAALAAGADMIGLVLTQSRRQLTPAQAREIVSALPPSTLTVGVFADEPTERINELAAAAGVHAVQHIARHIAGPDGQVPANTVLDLPAITVCSSADPALAHPLAFPGSMVLVEAAPSGVWGGVGTQSAEAAQRHWEVAARWARSQPILLAGGLHPANVSAAIAAVQPWGLDVSSGIEGPDGQKDPERMRAFVQAARAAEDQ